MVNRAQTSVPVRDFPTFGNFVFAFLAVSVGFLVSLAVGHDGTYGPLISPAFFGEEPPLINDLPFSLTGAVLLFALFLLGFFAWAFKTGSFDRPLLGVFVFSLFASAILYLHQVVFYALLFLLLIRFVRYRRVPIVKTPLIVPLLCIVLVYLTSYLKTVSLGATIATSWTSFMTMSLVVLIPTLIRTRRQLEILLQMLLISACVSVGVEFVQEFLSALTGRPVSFLSSSDNVMHMPFGLVPRLTGLMTHQNQQANVIAPVGILFLYFATKPKGALSSQRRTLYSFAYLFIGMGVLMTTSRSGWLSFGVATCLVPFVRWPRFIPAFVFLGGIVGVLGYISGFFGAIVQIIYDMSPSSADFRWHIDQIAMQAWWTAPWFGVGVNGIMQFFNPYQLPVHNTYLQILSEMGIAGVFSFLLLGGMVLVRAIHRFWQVRDPYDRDLFLGLFLASAVLIVQNMFAMFLWIRFLWVIIALLETTLLITRRSRFQPEESDLIFLANKS